MRRLSLPLSSALELIVMVNTEIRLSALRALLGNVPSSLRSFSAEVSGNVVRLRSIFDDTATEEHIELLSIVGAEIIADYPAEYALEEDFWKLSSSAQMEHLSELIFHRYEF
jgi:hypothetical protein